MISLSDFVHFAGFLLCLWLTLSNGDLLQRQPKNSFHNEQNLKPVFNVQRESVTTTTVQPTELNQEDIRKLITAALENGELLYPDELRKRNFIRRKQKWSPGQKDGSHPSTSLNEGISGLDEVTIGEVYSCNNLTLCEEEDPNYPEEQINQILQQDPNLKLLAFVDNILVKPRMDDDTESPLCLAYSRVLYPRRVKGIYGNWVKVINQKNFQQGVRVEICIEEGSNCSGYKNDHSGYTVTCEQQFIQRELVTIRADGKFQKIPYKHPANCCCKRRRSMPQ